MAERLYCPSLGMQIVSISVNATVCFYIHNLCTLNLYYNRRGGGCHHPPLILLIAVSNPSKYNSIATFISLPPEPKIIKYRGIHHTKVRSLAIYYFKNNLKRFLSLFYCNK